MNEIQNPPYEIPLSPSVGVEKSLFIKTPREKLAYCKGENYPKVLKLKILEKFIKWKLRLHDRNLG